MINVAIIGAGGIAKTHVESFLEFKDQCQIVAIVDQQKDKAEKLAADQKINPTIYENYQQILDNSDIDLVSICTPPFIHAEITVACLDHGKHVICEKPMANSLEECDAMIAAQKRNNKILSIVAQNRFFSKIQKLKTLIDSGITGKILHTNIQSFWWRGHTYYDLWWRGTWEKEGGGCTLSHAVHHLDMFQWILGMPSEVTAIIGNLSHDNSEVEDISMSIFKFANNTLGQITSSVVHHGEEQQMVFQGEKAGLAYPWKVYASTPRANGFPDPNTKLEAAIQSKYDALKDVEYEGHLGLINDVLLAIKNQSQPLVDGTQGRNVIEIATAIYKSASTQSNVQIPISTDDAFYTTEGLQRNVIHFYEKKTSVADFGDVEITVGASK
jgi:UDP-N-acetyl-2-amino-2-deoxyglucuronate dehydrogenase